MKITISEEANRWFIEEMGLEKGDKVRFFGKLYGKTDVHDNFSVGMRLDEPEDILTQIELDGITYFIDKRDEWFFSGYDFEITYDKENDDVIYRFVASN
ncbi:hypothetical protein GCM10010978_27600 [Compostibacillus humi]|jgi:uncharacterized protein YneR|uniref:Iron-sulfur cluster biosynthesis protein n=1 Tax=Compostibacillus humi TaxID=1245525 RepID=A0A8J2TSX8_9BACI|nr:iron-sulfur cluster biosynthesis protein [Compostibacillus humi]GFZ86032.1 hypothetical protein GCM10010978_27600 [Compostibacillus humi]HLT56391.1 iron-sulfur cluster biosynthesis protein [Bacillota bacterium]